MTKKEIKEESKVSLMLLFFRLQWAEETILNYLIRKLAEDGEASSMFHKRKQEFGRMQTLASQLLTKVADSAEEISKKDEKMNQWKIRDINRGMASAYARLSLALYDRFGDDYNQIQKFTNEFLDQTGGQEFGTVEKRDMDWLIFDRVIK